MIGIIAAVSLNNVIGKNGTIPWHHPEDFKRFKKTTEGTTVIMGRKTFESMGCKALKNRRNIVVSSQYKFDSVENAKSLFDALDVCVKESDIWLIGGARIYEEGMPYADMLDITQVREHVTINENDNIVYFPKIDDAIWKLVGIAMNECDDMLVHQIFYKKL